MFCLLLLCRSQDLLTDKNNITAGDTSDSINDHPRETATTAKGESSLYSEVIPANKRKKRASYSPGDMKVDNSCSKQVKNTGSSTEEYTPLWFTGGGGNTKEPPQEELYDQPVSLNAW
jgi:hypothetical protein